MPSLTARRVREQDLDRVRALHEAALRDAGAFVEGAPDGDLEAPATHYLDEGEFLVGTLGDRIVAMGAYRPAPDETMARFADPARPVAECRRLRVDPAHQRRGVGSELLADLEDRAAADGFRELVLDVGADQDAARGFYEAAGYECEGEVTVQTPDGPFDLALYRTRLEADP